ncbi:protein-glutamate O-methyltransferase CheR [Dissulfurirhabdus thermomarina]|uniref:protein-glutamate O-methyltransferase n=1 Tax=Dissulfurirhabdus thermomarina TaxID=1765737 RepID=A0A6N9TKN1_DISTH|nr:protein-glutamate O-methyltransferase CheR [Dissulfurirhabdus thermomarina]NMX22474.1 protein-glutamate O-methyltransferase CheR [Dissulfurirhabdus thermomarina]
MTPEQFSFFADLVKAGSGIALNPGKEYLLESRLNELARSLGLDGLDELYRKARHEMTPSLKEAVVEAMTTNETYFFRDQHPFEALRKEILPGILDRNRPGRRLRIWSAACSTGQEPYSIAMVLREHFPETAAWHVEILATDISARALEKGRAGRFTQVEVNRGLPVTYLLKYFKQDGAFWIADEALRKLVRFQQRNLLEPFASLGAFDVVFCRYVLIYFDTETKKAILDRLARALRPGGVLFLGATETPVWLPEGLAKEVHGKTYCWRRKDPAAADA